MAPAGNHLVARLGMLLNIGVLGVLTAATVLFPRWAADLGARLEAAASRWFVLTMLGVAVASVYAWVFVEGCRRGWWAVLGAEIWDRMASFQ